MTAPVRSTGGPSFSQPADQAGVPLSLKAGLIVALLGLASVIGLTVIEDGRRSLRDRAYSDVMVAARQLDDQAVEAAAANFMAAPSLVTLDARTNVVAGLVADSRHWPDLRRRNAAYLELHNGIERADEVVVQRAAADFLAACPAGSDDARAAQVRELAELAREWPLRRNRDAAYDALKRARGNGNDLAVLDAAVQFLRARPLTEPDPRTDQVRQWYRETFTRWFVGGNAEIDAATRARVDQYAALQQESGTK